MKNISIELVPRSREALGAELREVRESFPDIDTVNIPDLLQFSLRSWEGCRLARPLFSNVIPHLRAIDFDLDKPFPLKDFFVENGIDSVLVIVGDQPQDMKRRVYRTTSVELIRVLKKEMPALKVYAGIDQYRSGIKAELDYVKEKLDAGADGFFTQPFFDMRLMDIYNDLLAGSEVYWGISPVMSEKSRAYWENRNNAIFPPDFETSLEWNRNFARQAIDFSSGNGSNLYFMPIRVDVVDYLSGILS